ncbi:MAG: glycosyltransferase family 1 protein [Vulcanimicrobiaceae bacterium]
MRVGLDAQLARGTATGIGEYVTGLAAALRASAIDVVTLESERFDPWRFDRRVLWDQVLLPLAAARARVDVLHCASGTMPYRSPVPIVVTVHDVAWLRVQQHARSYARAYFGAFALGRYARARRIVVDSAFSRDELLATASDAGVALVPDSIAVAYPGVAADVMHNPRARDDDRPFVLVVGTVEARKNLAVLVRALARSPALRIVSVGPPTPYAATCRALARELGVEDRLDLRGYVSRAELLALYGAALVAAVPSHYEGFGYGAAQALCAGVPLIAAATSSLPEVVGDAAALVPPNAVEAWAEALAAIVRDPNGAERRADAQRDAARTRFAWATCARTVAAVYARALVDG